MHNVYEKLQATGAKVTPVNLFYWSHFSATGGHIFMKCLKIWTILQNKYIDKRYTQGRIGNEKVICHVMGLGGPYRKFQSQLQ